MTGLFVYFCFLLQRHMARRLPSGRDSAARGVSTGCNRGTHGRVPRVDRCAQVAVRYEARYLVPAGHLAEGHFFLDLLAAACGLARRRETSSLDHAAAPPLAAEAIDPDEPDLLGYRGRGLLDRVPAEPSDPFQEAGCNTSTFHAGWKSSKPAILLTLQSRWHGQWPAMATATLAFFTLQKER